ncbi:hypothetical protein E8E14_006139 [Neopestalotiopsis sp. 37M]|nr:hypothetical protein E8E14_006139 [Neopestalotiopsis sp. 37M]
MESAAKALHHIEDPELNHSKFVKAEEEREKERMKTRPAPKFEAPDYKPPEQQYREMRASEVQHDQRREDRARRRMERQQKRT